MKNLHSKELRDKFKEGYNRGLEKGYKEGNRDGYHKGMTQDRKGVHLSQSGIYVFDDETTKQAVNKHKLI